MRMRVAGALACALAVTCAASAQARPQAVIAFLPPGPGETRPLLEELAARGMAIGMTSPTVGGFDARQMALDMSQGTRIPTRLYSKDIGVLRLRGGRMTGWDRVLRRASDAPGDLKPGLLASTIERAGGRVGYKGPADGAAAIVAANRAGRVSPLRRGDTLGVFQLAPGLPGLRQLDQLLAARGRDDLVYVVRAPSGSKQRLLPSGIAGPGIRGQLRSATTRRTGLVAATDVAPTVLRALGVGVPDDMQGQPIEGRGRADAKAVEDMAGRLAVVTSRRGVTLQWLAGAWLLILAALQLRAGERGVRTAVRAGLLAALWVPGLALLTAALEPSRLVEAAIVGVGAVLLGLITDRLAGWPLAPAIPAAIVFLAYTVDLARGSPLIGASIAGPNPAGGARFYGIGNELEVILSCSVLIGAGAALAWRALGDAGAAAEPQAAADPVRAAAGPDAMADPGRRRTDPARAASHPGGGADSSGAAVGFAVVAAIAAVIMGAGRLGADVGAVITLGAGGAAAVIAALPQRPSRRAIALGIAAPVAAIGALILLDVVTGGGAHLTRSVVHAHGSGDLIDVARRRFEGSFTTLKKPGWTIASAIALAVMVWLAVRRTRLLDGLPRPLAAGLVGAWFSVVVGAIANDSGPLILVVGAILLLLGTGYAQSRPRTLSGRRSSYA
jgi:hypothetical protein